MIHVLLLKSATLNQFDVLVLAWMCSLTVTQHVAVEGNGKKKHAENNKKNTHAHKRKNKNMWLKRLQNEWPRLRLHLTHFAKLP